MSPVSARRDRERDDAPDREPEQAPAALPGRPPLIRGLSGAQVLQLQRFAGNRAVTAMIQRDPDWVATGGSNRDTQVPAVDIAAKYQSANNAILQKIADALSSAADVDAIMRDLSGAVQTRMKTAASADAALDAELVDWETKGGFDGPPTIVSKILSSEQFQTFGKIPRMFHDLGVSKAHGIETHRLQWHVLIRVVKQLAVPVTARQLYIEIQKTDGLWRDLFDRDLNYATGSSPETFMNLLRTHADTRYPALAQIYDVKVGRNPVLGDKQYLRQWWDTIGVGLAKQPDAARPVFPATDPMEAIGGDITPLLLGNEQKKASKGLAQYSS